MTKLFVLRKTRGHVSRQSKTLGVEGKQKVWRRCGGQTENTSQRMSLDKGHSFIQESRGEDENKHRCLFLYRNCNL